MSNIGRVYVNQNQRSAIDSTLYHEQLSPGVTYCNFVQGVRQLESKMNIASTVRLVWGT